MPRRPKPVRWEKERENGIESEGERESWTRQRDRKTERGKEFGIGWEMQYHLESLQIVSALLYGAVTVHANTRVRICQRSSASSALAKKLLKVVAVETSSAKDDGLE